MQADVAYALYADKGLDFLQLASAHHRDCKIFVPDKLPENFSSALRKSHVVGMASQADQRAVEIEKQNPMIRIANASDCFGPGTAEVAQILCGSPLAGH